MKKCIVTGLKTHRLWKGHPLHPIVLEKAKRDNRFSTMRETVKFIANDFHARTSNRKFENVQEFIDYITDYFEEKE